MKNSEKPISPIFNSDGFVSSFSELDKLDNNCTGLTKLEYACIKLGIPETGDLELDNLIRKSEKNRLAGLAMHGILANPQLVPIINTNEDSKDVEMLSIASIKLTEELLKQLENETAK